MHSALADQPTAARLDGRAVVSGASPGQWPEETDRVVLGAVPLPVAGDHFFPLPLTAAGRRGPVGDLADRVAHRGAVLPRDRRLEPRIEGYRTQAGLLVLRSEDVEPGHWEPGCSDRDIAPEGPFTGQRHQVRLGRLGRVLAGRKTEGATCHHGTSTSAGLPGAGRTARPSA